MKINSSLCLIILFVEIFTSGKCHIVTKHNELDDTEEYHQEENKTISPVIFVPGDGGSQMDAKLNKTDVVHYVCSKTSDWFNIWLNMELLVPVVVDCWIDNVRLIYDNVTRKTSNVPGVELRIPGWGDPEVVEWIDPSHATSGIYFKDIGNALVDKLGYIRKHSIRGAPYDFRKGPAENKQWFIDMKKLIEDTYQQNNKTAVTLITHSMGSPMTLILLQQQPQEWKRKYISKWISIAGAWAGSVKAVKVFAMGDDLGALALISKTMRSEQITMPSLAWLLPSPYFWKHNEVLVETPSRTYTMSQLKDYFDDINYPTGWEMRLDTLPYVLNFEPPDVPLYAIYGSQLPTVEKLVYKKDSIAGESPKLVMGDGDGTVNVRSLEACVQWKDLQKPNITLLNLPKVEHLAILSDPRAIDYIVNILSD